MNQDEHQENEIRRVFDEGEKLYKMRINNYQNILYHFAYMMRNSLLGIGTLNEESELNNSM